MAFYPWRIRVGLNDTKSSFNAVAAGYDNRDNQNPILQWMRSIVHKVYLKHLPAGAKILELNAGTGVDAIFLAENGFSVYATDISDEMINILKSKVKLLEQSGSETAPAVRRAKIEAKALSFDEISEIEENEFDAIVSNFGGLNCINDFTKLSVDLYAKLKPGGLFIAVVMNKICPWEIFYYSVRLNFKEAFRRFNKQGIMAELNGEKVHTFYFTPGEFTAA
ncbi:MAG TPA: methyltransferase domain-containing protein, partial [Ignavibacteria bacterium]|nr:methyltransferase domain-containing protein [Ignavibacteria bacterium]